MSIQPMSSHRSIRLVALTGSVRDENNTAKAVEAIRTHLAATPGIDLTIIHPGDLDLRLPGKGDTEDAAWLRAKIREADGVILATPEYHGSYSSVMKLMIDNLGFPSTLSKKPVALIGVAAGRIGAVKALEHLRSVASHVGALVLPGAVSIADARSAFDSEGRIKDATTDKLFKALANSLVDYATPHTQAGRRAA